MANTIEVSMDRMRSDVTALETMLDRTRGHIRELQQAMAELEQMWKGPASQAMGQRFRRDLESIRDLTGQLEDLVQVLNAMRGNYDTCESNVRDEVDRTIR